MADNGALGQLTLVLVALAETAGAAALGWFAGCRLRRRSIPMRALAGALALAGCVAAIALGSTTRARASDLITAAATLLGAGFAATVWHRLRSRGRALKYLVAALVFLELGTRYFDLRGLSSEFLPKQEQQALLPAQGLWAEGPYIAKSMGVNHQACDSIFADRFPGPLANIRNAAAGASRIALHVGDSLVHTVSDTGREEDLFTHRLPAPPGWRHVNFARGDTGPDAQFLMVRTWMSLERADLVVWYIDIENDLTDIGMGYSCCDLGPLLDYEGGTARPRCQEPHWPSRTRRWFINSGPPAFLGLLARGSRLAGWVSHLLFEHASHDGTPEQALEPERRQHFTAILKSMRDLVEAKGGHLVVTVMPDLELFLTEKDQKTRPSATTWVSATRFVAETARALNVPFLDLEEAFAPFTEKEGMAALYGTPNHPNDRHFTAHGHERFASVVAPALAPLLPGAVWPPALTSVTMPSQ